MKAHIHFIGIGGIGLSSLAQYFLKKGYKVSGSDLSASETTRFLEKLGIKIFIGPHRRLNIPKAASRVIYSAAIKNDNPELREARRRKILVQSYSEALGEITKEYFTIAISGTHGKSTTTALVALILKAGGLDPTVVVGTKLREFKNNNFRMGKSRYLVIEADEYRAAFYNYYPRIIVLTNIDEDHLDYYQNLKDIISAFGRYLLNLSPRGFLVLNKDDKNLSRLPLKKLSQKIYYYSLSQKEASKIRKILKIPGQHNVSNALAAFTVGRILKIPSQTIFKALGRYRGSWRRFEIIFKRPFILISDYGHHPTEIKATLLAAREKFKDKNIWLVFQPHQYERTKKLFKRFVDAFCLCDHLILTEIFGVAGREKNKNISSRSLKKAIDKKYPHFKTYFIKDYLQVLPFLENRLRSDDVLIVMGAGSIYNLVLKLKEKYLKRK